MSGAKTAAGTSPESTPINLLREQLRAAAEEFATASHPVGEILQSMVSDVARAGAEPLEIFPVCHHSPASALHLVQRLHKKAPRVIFMELCEDLRGSLDGLKECKLPVALQAFAQSTDAFPKGWSPLSVVAPLTEFSAEYQAIAFALSNPGTELCFVDRAVDYVFQWMPQKEDELEKHVPKDEEQDDGGAQSAPTPGTSGGDEELGVPDHGASIGVQMGNVEPTFEAFVTFLLRNARVRHFAEWWDQYVEQAVLGADYETYRYVMFLVGSLLRRLGRKDEDHENDKRRERYMWTRMKQHLKAHGIAPGDALYICGAVHAVSDVPEFGSAKPEVWAIPPRTATKWLYGLVPSSFVAIEHQFGHPSGTVALAENTWDKGLAALGIKAFALTNKSATPAAAPKAGKAKAAAAPAVTATVTASAAPPDTAQVLGFLTRPPTLMAADEEQLLRWSVDIVGMARKNGYLASTADAIAIYQTSVLLANLRNRRHPSPYDFEDAAVTCLEKDRSVKKRNVTRLCQILMGGNRSGQVGYAALPPLAQDVYDRLKPLGVNLKSSRIERALIDFKKSPELLPCSDLLWALHFLTGGHRVLRPIMGERKLGHTPVQESWDIAIGQYQEAIIRLGYEGVTVEHVLEKRLKTAAFGPSRKTLDALHSARNSLLFLRSVRLTEELGERAVELLREETGAQDAPKVVEVADELDHYYSAQPTGLPHWLKDFIATGYAHYAMLLPTAFGDRGASPEQVASMLEFMSKFEPQALALGCKRSQLEIAIKQAGPVTEDPIKIGLLWAAEWRLKLRDVGAIRESLNQALENPLMLPVFPQYVSGFLLALKFAPEVGRLVVELLSKAFARLPEEILFPWLPGLLMSLRPHRETILPDLLKEASNIFPKDLKALGAWSPPWERAAKAAPAAAPAATGAAGDTGPAAAPVSAPAAALSADEQAVAELLKTAPSTATALAALLGA